VVSAAHRQTAAASRPALVAARPALVAVRRTLVDPRRTLVARLALIALAGVAVAGCLPASLPGRTQTPASPAAFASPPVGSPSASPEPTATMPLDSPGTIESPTPDPTPAPSPTAKPKPPKRPVTFNLVASPARHFISEQRKTWCAAAGTQMVLALNGKVALTAAAQTQIVAKSKAYWSWADSHNRGWGPLMMSKVLAAYGVPGYVVRTYQTRDAALIDAAKAIETTHQPALLLVWWGAHTWVMTGFKATADPRFYADAKVAGTFILDPWYPRISSIWGPSDPPGTFQNQAEMVRNYIRWTRPEGLYKDRDHRFVAVIPTIAKP
jgi:hypothetical protein